ncbi:MAG: hypothetical protein J6386_07730 [Candidatus Synoicihabitans palmerolidicus]|nr:hypothetical protein [Candidatus Synoicihabitans palmerolidicus]
MFDELNGKQTSNLADVVRHRGETYTYSPRFLYRMVAPGETTPGRLERLRRPSESLWALNSHPRGLLVGTASGLLNVAGETAEFILRDEASTVGIGWHPDDPDTILSGSLQGLNELHWDGAQWLSSGVITGTESEIRTIAFESLRAAWLGTTTREFVRIERPDAPDSRWRDAKITHYYGTRGLPANLGWSHVVAVPVGIAFLTAKGVY